MTQVTTKRTVLVVDDDEALLRVAARVLKVHGYEVLSATGCHEAIALIGSHPEPVDMLLTDMQMPEMDGCELANRLAESHPELKVLFTSGYPAQVAQAPDAGACPVVNFIEKPYAMSELARRVQEVFDAEPPAH